MAVSNSASVEGCSKDLETTGREIRSPVEPALAVEPLSEVPKVIPINKAPRSRDTKSQEILTRPRSSQALLALAGQLLLLGKGSQKAPIEKDLSQFPIPILGTIVSWWSTLKTKVEPSWHQRLDQGDRGPPF
ncbi:hypothetical protein [Moorena sp. SIO3H5]|uniref:hypothetical protein n=1 Tax=Moorena sp. SIO3H5 TaxID=2607834 RepID=UPI0025EB357F|nr:hypothetical protein [Moorena sp. SIO3H5]